MIGISKLYLGVAGPSDALRYGRGSPSSPPSSAGRKPVVVWNVTARCNLRCRHCYAAVPGLASDGELTYEEGRALIDDLVAFGCRVLLFSGGEPLMRPDLFDLAGYAASRGLRCVLSTNGTLVGQDTARRLRRVGMSYVGVSLDGLRATHDDFRGRAGAFDEACAGLRACREAGLKVGLRFTIVRRNAQEAADILRLAREERVPRVCFYHLVYCGRGMELVREDLTHGETRAVVDTIVDHAGALRRDGSAAEVLTVDNHCDGPYLYLRMLREKSPRAADALALLRINGGNSSGIGIACVGWDGTVYPDPFWRSRALGNVRRQPFRRVWTDPANALLAQLREKTRHVTGRCARCRFLDICGGNLRARAEALTGDPWASDPACYLTDEEIGVA